MLAYQTSLISKKPCSRICSAGAVRKNSLPEVALTAAVAATFLINSPLPAFAEQISTQVTPVPVALLAEEEEEEVNYGLVGFLGLIGYYLVSSRDNEVLKERAEKEDEEKRAAEAKVREEEQQKARDLLIESTTAEVTKKVRKEIEEEQRKQAQEVAASRKASAKEELDKAIASATAKAEQQIAAVEAEKQAMQEQLDEVRAQLEAALAKPPPPAPKADKKKDQEVSV